MQVHLWIGLILITVNLLTIVQVVVKPPFASRLLNITLASLALTSAVIVAWGIV